MSDSSVMEQSVERSGDVGSGAGNMMWPVPVGVRTMCTDLCPGRINRSESSTQRHLAPPAVVFVRTSIHSSSQESSQYLEKGFPAPSSSTNRTTRSHPDRRVRGSVRGRVNNSPGSTCPPRRSLGSASSCRRRHRPRTSDRVHHHDRRARGSAISGTVPLVDPVILRTTLSHRTCRVIDTDHPTS